MRTAVRAAAAGGDGLAGFLRLPGAPEPPQARLNAERHDHVVFIGVVPEQRGLGYVRDLLLAGTAAARDVGFTALLSDADVLNAPMAAAFEATGHRGDARRWHVWHHRLADPAAVSSPSPPAAGPAAPTTG